MARSRQRAGGFVYVTVRTVGELMITVGVLVLLFVVYSLYVTDLIAAREQDAVSEELERSWAAPGQPDERPEVVTGEPLNRLGIPRFGEDFRFTVVEGIGQEELAVGPGHYPDTALPGEPGNVGIAGHRIGKGAPFNDLDKLEACDPIVVETARDYFVYRVMPMREQVGQWSQLKQRDPRCAKVPSLRDDEAERGPYAQTYGRRIVTPDRRDAVAAVPYKPGAALPKADQAALLTLTTCHPEFGNSERMIIHAVLTDQEPKASAGGYRQLLDKLGEA